MRFFQEGGFAVKAGKMPEFQAWVEANLDAFKASYPEGTALIGFFVSVYSSEKNAGDVRVIEQLDSYAALDRLAAAGKDQDSVYSRLGSEMNAFIDMSPGAGWTVTLLKDLVDATVYRVLPDAEAELVLSGAKPGPG